MSDEETAAFDPAEMAAHAQACKAGAQLALKEGRYFTAGLLHAAAAVAERVLVMAGEAPVWPDADPVATPEQPKPPRRGRKPRPTTPEEMADAQLAELREAEAARQAPTPGTVLVTPEILAASSAATVTAALPIAEMRQPVIQGGSVG